MSQSTQPSSTVVTRPGPLRPVTPMSILAARLARITVLLERTEGIDPGIVAEMHAAAELACGLDPYVGRCTTPESPALRRLTELTEAEDWSRHPGTEALHLEPEMLSGHVEGQALKMLVHLCRAQRVLEIGMFTGYSALAMAEALPEDGQIVACEIDPDVAEFAQRCFDDSPSGQKISVREGPALPTLAQLADAGEIFDLIFIDADKAGYIDYVDVVLTRGLLAPTGVICVDNTLLQGQPYLDSEPSANGAAIAAFNVAVANDPRVDQVMVPLRDGLTLIRWAAPQRSLAP